MVEVHPVGGRVASQVGVAHSIGMVLDLLGFDPEGGVFPTCAPTHGKYSYSSSSMTFPFIYSCGKK